MNNRLHALPQDLRAWQSLRVLDACYNALQALPMSMASLTSLRPQFERQPTANPTQSSSMRSLRRLDLRENQLQSLPRARHIPKLERLDLRLNPTLTLPTWIGALEDAGCSVWH